jgi:Bacterial SH3 domain
MSRSGRSSRFRSSAPRWTVSILVFAAISLLMLSTATAQAQVDSPEVGASIRVTNTGGQRLNVRAGPAADQLILARLPAGELLTVTGAARTVGTTRWVPVRTATGQQGWVSAEFVALVSGPSPASPVAEPVMPSASTAADRAASELSAVNHRREAKGRPVVVEAKLKFPEVQGREQEITVWVTRDGAPVPGAVVTLESSDGEEGERFRQLDPTNGEGRTRRSFDVRHEKGTVELQVEAVAPDGGEGRTIVSYFKR